MGLARAANLPVVLVGDIDRGGLLAHLFGTVAVLEPDDQALIAGFVVNKFRGDPALLEPGLQQLHAMTGRPTYGVLPYADELWLDAEDSLSVVAHRVVGTPAPPRGGEWLRVAAVRLPRISNSTDVEALACEPGRAGALGHRPRRPGRHRPDRRSGQQGHRRRPVVAARARPGRRDRRPRPGRQAGAGHLRGIPDAVPAHRRPGGIRARGRSPGWGCWTPTSPSPRPRYCAAGGRRSPDTKSITAGCRGAPRRPGSQVGLRTARASCAARSSAPTGTACSTTTTSVARWLTGVADAAGRSGFVVAADTNVAARRDAQLDVIADLLAAHLDVDAVLGLLDGPAAAAAASICGQ